MMSISAIGGSQDFSRIQNRRNRPVIDGSYAEKKIESEKKAPYSYMADENGYIQYHGVVFYCDDEKQTISLGDISDPKQVLTIPLEDGGCLKVNRANIGDLSHAISMFTPGDVRRILSAIAQDAHCTRKINEIEEMEDTAVSEAVSRTEDEDV